VAEAARRGELLTERLRPVRLTEMTGNAPALELLRKWARGWGPGKSPPSRRAALLVGRPGVGKTTAAWALAREEGWTVVEMNASEARNRTAIEQVAGRASFTNAFSEDGRYRSAREGGRTLILLDEADCLSGRATESTPTRHAPPNLREFLRGRYGSVTALAEGWKLGGKGAPPAFATWEDVPASPGRAAWSKLSAAQRDISDWRGSGERSDSSDRGGLAAIAALVRTTLQPVVLTVNDPSPLTRYSPVFRTGVSRIDFGPVGASELRHWLREVIARERFAIQTPALERIVERSQGDLRAALTDLDAIAPLPPGPEQLAILGGRDRTAELEEYVAEIFSHPRLYRTGEVAGTLDMPPDDLLPWIEENIPRAAPPGPRPYAAFEVLGRAELFLSRARRYRHWGLWSYATELMTGGVSSALDRAPEAMRPEVRFPGFLAAMGHARVQRALRLSLLGKVGDVLHLSTRKGGESMLPMLFVLFDPDRDSPATRSLQVGMIRRAKLTAEEVGFLLGREPDSEAVLALLAAAEPAVARSLPPSSDPGPADAPSGEIPVEPSPGPPSERPSPKAGRTGRQKGLGEF
jgi:DNA polymerase III delta prime subunit